nr:GNAT family protein [uncultured Tolumonas sp.]
MNQITQPIGHALPDWQPCSFPEAQILNGSTCRLEPLNPVLHAEDLCHAFLHSNTESIWTYLPFGPFADETLFLQHLHALSQTKEVMHFAVIDLFTQQAIGTLALMRIDAANGVAEIGYVTFSPSLQRTTMATEAIFLLLDYLFDELNYRRCEWKCDHLNAPSRRAAERIGFQFEGIFRQASVYKQRSRDTAWYAIIDQDWPAIRTAIAHWLSADNFTDDGRQKQSLNTFKVNAEIE